MGLTVPDVSSSISVFGAELHPLAAEMQWRCDDASADMHVRRVDGRLTIHVQADAELARLKPTAFQFEHIRIERGQGLKQPLMRACGLHKRADLRIFDACAGTGVDAYILAHFAASIFSCERQPLVFALLRDAMTRGAQHLPWELQRADALDCLEQVQDCDVAYLDPMFHMAKRRGAERKEMRLLSYLDSQQASEQGNDALLAGIAQSAIPRLVLKRGLKMSLTDLPHRQHTHSITGKGFRFDVYQRC